MQTVLQRKLGLFLVTFYGLGTIVGAGIYVLIGEIASVSGQHTTWAFLLAGLIASLTGACYAELSARYPTAAGAVLYIDKAFSNKHLSRITGMMILLTGIVSAATITRGFVGYLNLYINIPDWLAIILLVLVLGSIAIWGIKETASTVAFITILEVFGLLMVIVLVSLSSGETTTYAAPPNSLSAIVLGSFLAFYAFIGFEDMVNLAEEMKSAERDMPRAIFIALFVAILLYVSIAAVAVKYTNLVELADSRSPLAYMLGEKEIAVMVIGLISLVAITNGALTQIVMGSRVLYGMSRQNILPRGFGQIWGKTSTPALGTLAVTAAILGFALWFPLTILAKLTSSIMLVIFVMINLSLIKTKISEPEEISGGFRIPLVIPIIAFVFNTGLLGYQLLHI